MKQFASLFTSSTQGHLLRQLILHNIMVSWLGKSFSHPQQLHAQLQIQLQQAPAQLLTACLPLKVWISQLELAIRNFQQGYGSEQLRHAPAQPVQPTTPMFTTHPYQRSAHGVLVTDTQPAARELRILPRIELDELTNDRDFQEFCQRPAIAALLHDYETYGRHGLQLLVYFLSQLHYAPAEVEQMLVSVSAIPETWKAFLTAGDGKEERLPVDASAVNSPTTSSTSSSTASTNYANYLYRWQLVEGAIDESDTDDCVAAQPALPHYCLQLTEPTSHIPCYPVITSANPYAESVSIDTCDAVQQATTTTFTTSITSTTSTTSIPSINVTTAESKVAASPLCYYFYSVASTHKLVEQLAKYSNICDAWLPPLVMAWHQAAAIGRNDRSWLTRGGQDVAATLLFAEQGYRPYNKVTVSAYVCQLVQQGCSLMSQLLNSEFQPEFRIKWPNDIYVGEYGAADDSFRKVAGVLCASVGKSMVVSFGINMLPFASSTLPKHNHDHKYDHNYDQPLYGAVLTPAAAQQLTPIQISMATLDLAAYIQSLLFSAGDFNYQRYLEQQIIACPGQVISIHEQDQTYLAIVEEITPQLYLKVQLLSYEVSSHNSSGDLSSSSQNPTLRKSDASASAYPTKLTTWVTEKPTASEHTHKLVLGTKKTFSYPVTIRLWHANNLRGESEVRGS